MGASTVLQVMATEVPGGTPCSRLSFLHLRGEPKAQERRVSSTGDMLGSLGPSWGRRECGAGRCQRAGRGASFLTPPRLDASPAFDQASPGSPPSLWGHFPPRVRAGWLSSVGTQGPAFLQAGGEAGGVVGGVLSTGYPGEQSLRGPWSSSPGKWDRSFHLDCFGVREGPEWQEGPGSGLAPWMSSKRAPPLPCSPSSDSSSRQLPRPPAATCISRPCPFTGPLSSLLREVLTGHHPVPPATALHSLCHPPRACEPWEAASTSHSGPSSGCPSSAHLGVENGARPS